MVIISRRIILVNNDNTNGERRTGPGGRGSGGRGKGEGGGVPLLLFGEDEIKIYEIVLHSIIII